MARTATHVAATPERVWAVLADPPAYERWIVGCRDVRRWDPHWPAPGSAFHHTFLLGPLPIKDTTSVLEAEPERKLVLRARARPVGVARVTIVLTAERDGTRVEIAEWPVEGPPAALHNPLQDWLINRRNDESLRRLRTLAERR